MMRKALPVVAIIVGAGVVALAIVLILASRAPASLEFGVRDAQSGAWVWDLTARMQDRYLRGFYQLDAGPIAFQLRPVGADSKAILNHPSRSKSVLSMRTAVSCREESGGSSSSYQVVGLLSSFS